MDFGLSDEQLALQETARRFAQGEIQPIAAEFDQSGEFPREVMKKAWELGLSSTCIEEPYGGVGLSVLVTDAHRGLGIGVEDRGAGHAQIKRAAIEGGMTTLHRDSMTKVRRGLTTIAEALRVVRPDDIG